MAYLSGEAGTSDGLFARVVTLLVSLVLPDFQLFNVIDSVIEGQVMPIVYRGEIDSGWSLLRGFLHPRLMVHFC